MANWTEINNAFSSRLTGWVETDIAWDNVDFDPDESTTPDWIRCTLLPNNSENNEIGVSKIHHGIFWIQIFTPLNKGSARAYEIATMLEALFSNVEFDGVVCYTADVQRTGDEGHNWFQLNLKVNFWSHERI